ncbi:MAG: dephospho-CoA kinase [Clostridia bacterium]|nr:dephospho-CoA kinase [Clostridia bacterium]MBR6890134.1 dephospho-CoA kinase [Clostridia bacterium]
MLANKPYVIGLTGGIGTGKTDAARYLESLGAARVDADAVSRALTGPGGEALDEIRRVFGDAAFHPDGALDRAVLGKLVFANEAARRALEGIMHPLVQRDMLMAMDAAAEAGAKVVVLDVPLLFETGMDALCDETWTLYVSREIQISRVAARDGLSREEIEARIDSQMPTEARIARATHAIDTDRPVERTRAELEQLYRAAVKRAEKG